MKPSILDKIKKLNMGENIKCSKCNEGNYRPIGSNTGDCYHFHCDHCGNILIATKRIKA